MNHMIPFKQFEFALPRAGAALRDEIPHEAAKSDAAVTVARTNDRARRWVATLPGLLGDAEWLLSSEEAEALDLRP